MRTSRELASVLRRSSILMSFSIVEHAARWALLTSEIPEITTWRSGKEEQDKVEQNGSFQSGEMISVWCKSRGLDWKESDSPELDVPSWSQITLSLLKRVSAEAGTLPPPRSGLDGSASIYWTLSNSKPAIEQVPSQLLDLCSWAELIFPFSTRDSWKSRLGRASHVSSLKEVYFKKSERKMSRMCGRERINTPTEQMKTITILKRNCSISTKWSNVDAISQD